MNDNIMTTQSKFKMRRIKWVDKPDPLSWQWQKDLLENNETLKVYDCNPFVAVFNFRENLYGLMIENADGLADVWMYLIVGPEKGLLIDTGYGIGDTRALVEEILDGKPYYVANTHCGIDHTFGNCRFDKVYCFPGEVPKLERQDEHIWDYLFDEKGDPIWMDFSREDLPVFKKYEISVCEDGHIFDLGAGYEVEMLWLPGHAEGHAAFLDKSNRILFTGDSITSMLGNNGLVDRPNPKPIFGGPHCNYKSFRKELDKIMARYDQFDKVFPQHLMNDIDKSLIPNMVKAVDEILRDPENYDGTYSFINKNNELESCRLKNIAGFPGRFGYNV
jgi:glyoxylase-like metal-dependent hydrolase (beta-lactamase superfamily II)